MGRVIHKVESRNNPGDILLPWNCASVRKSHIPHSSFKVASTPNWTKTNHHWLNHLQTLHTYYATSLAVGVSGSYLIGRKKAGKKWGIFLPVTNFFADNFFYQRLIFNDEYSYRHFFYKREHLFSDLKIPLGFLIFLVYLFDLKFD